MKIMIITNYWKNSNGGGVKTYVTNLAEELKKNDNLHVDIIYREGYDDNNDNINISGNKLLFSLRSFGLLSRFKPDAIYSQGTWYCLLGGVLYKILNPKSKLIHTFHTHPTNNINAMEIKLIQLLISRCDFVTFVSKGLQRDITEKYSLKVKNSVITYSGVREKNVSEKEIELFIEKYKIKNESIILLVQAFTANQLKAKGVECVMDAISYLKIRYPNILLILTRKGLYANKLMCYAESLGISNQVIITEELDNPFIPIKLSDVFIFPWLGNSGVGIALLEAMIMEKPIIATIDQDVSEAIENGVNGLLVNPNYIQIAEKIELILNSDNSAITLGKNAKITAINNFSWQKTANQFLELIR